MKPSEKLGTIDGTIGHKRICNVNEFYAVFCVEPTHYGNLCAAEWTSAIVPYGKLRHLVDMGGRAYFTSPMTDPGLAVLIGGT